MLENTSTCRQEDTGIKAHTPALLTHPLYLDSVGPSPRHSQPGGVAAIRLPSEQSDEA